MVLQDVEERYKGDDYTQLGGVADYFEGSFREADIPFNKTVLEQSVFQASPPRLKQERSSVLNVLCCY